MSKSEIHDLQVLIAHNAKITIQPKIEIGTHPKRVLCSSSQLNILQINHIIKIVIPKTANAFISYFYLDSDVIESLVSGWNL